MKRRGFLGAALAASLAPAIVRASSLMPIVAPRIIVPGAAVGTIHQFFGERGMIAARLMTDAGWMPCDGRVLSRALYPEVFKALGSTKLPDLRSTFMQGLA